MRISSEPGVLCATWFRKDFLQQFFMVGIGADYLDSNVLQSYDPIKKIGRGLYGIVWKAKPKSMNHDQAVAIKRYFNAFSNKIDAKRTYRELSYLLQFCKHPNIVSVRDVIRSDEDMDIYVVMEHMDVDLSCIIQRMLIFRV